MSTIGVIALFDFIFLITIIAVVVLIFSILSGYGGVVGKAFNIIGWGTVIMGISYIIETIFINLPGHHQAYAIIFIHHFLVAFGFVMIAYGFKILMKK